MSVAAGGALWKEEGARQRETAWASRVSLSRGASVRGVSPNELWLSDIEEHRGSGGKLYVWAVKDVFTNRVVGSSIDARMKSSFAFRALNKAVMRRGNIVGCVLHTESGSQFRSWKICRVLDQHGMVEWMGLVRRRQLRF